MLVYHGTMNCALESIQSKGVWLKRRNYHRNRLSFSTTTDFNIGTLFAARRSSADSFLKGVIDGIVLEFELNEQCWKDFEPVKDNGVLQDEKEIAVYNGRILKLLAVWRHQSDTWEREDLT